MAPEAFLMASMGGGWVSGVFLFLCVCVWWWCFFPSSLLTISAQTCLTRLVKFINISRWGEDLGYQEGMI